MSIRRLSPRAVPVSQTDLQVTPTFGRDVDRDGSIRVDLMLGHVAGTPQFSLQHTDSTAWETIETIAAVANPGVTCTFTAGSQNITATAHNLYENQLVTLHSTGQLPSALRTGHLYYVHRVISANVVQLLPHNIVTFTSNAIVDTGSGTHSLVPVVNLSSRLLDTIVADQPYLPVRRQLRWIATTTLGQTAQVIGTVIR